MPRVQIDNLAIEAADGATILDVAQSAGIAIPTLCHMKGIEPQTSCLVCVVRVNGGRRLLPACATRVTEGMVIESSSPAVREARKTALELLLAEHGGECFAPCSQVCPAHLDIPEMVRQIREGETAQAVQTVREALVLPATLGYVCPGLCEKGCRRGSADESVSICSLHKFVGENDLKNPAPWLPEKKSPTGKRIAIIGAGPAGLATAYVLLQAGHSCTIFDTHEKAGGILRYGLEPGKLPDAILAGEVAVIDRLGPTWQLGTTLDPAEAAKQFDAVAVTSGSGHGERIFVSASASAARPHAVQAVADGKELAAHVNAYLAGRGPSGKRFAVRLSALSPREMDLFMGTGTPAPRTAPASGTFSPEEASREADRCMLCGCSTTDTCRLRRYAIEYGAEPSRYRGRRREVRKITSHPDLVFEEGKCISCGLCIAIAKRDGERWGLSFVRRGFEVSVAAPLDKSWAEALQTSAMAAADACPTGAIHRKDMAHEPGACSCG
jgi:ferredoxin